MRLDQPLPPRQRRISWRGWLFLTLAGGGGSALIIWATVLAFTRAVAGQGCG